jgi:ABC-2 type transport system permease protein
MRGYGAIVRNTFIQSLSFRADFIIMVLGNLAGVFVVYYVWRAVYAGDGGDLNGLSFLQAFTYVAVSGAIFTMVETWAEWELGEGISRGDIVMKLYLPFDLHWLIVFEALGIFLFRFIFTGAPFIAFLILAFQIPVPLGINLLFFTVSLLLSFLISINIDFMTGVSAFSFESVLGLKLIKDALILFLAGAVIPLPFFPKAVQSVLMVLPFQAMYYTPVNLLLGDKTIAESLVMLLVQAGWIVFFIAAGRLFHRRVMGKLTVSGG